MNPDNLALKTYDEKEALEEKLRKKEKEVEKLLKQIRDLCARKEQFENQLDEVLHSKSWRITKPIRTFFETMRKVFPLFRSTHHAYTLEAGRNTNVSGTKVSIKGPSPTLKLIPSKTYAQYPYGWVKVEGSLEMEQNHGFFFLYYRTSDGFSEHNRFWLTYIDGKPLEQLFYLPRGIKKLRLDPFNAEGSLDIKDFSIKELGTVQVVTSVLRKHLGNAIGNPRAFIAKLSKAWAVYKEGGLTALRIRLFADNITSNFQEWVKKYDTLSERDCSLILKHLETFSLKPLISVIMPTWNTPERWLRAAIESVQNQIYPNWELCISDDASTDTNMRRVLQEYADKDLRIKVHFRTQNGHIAEASNSALALAKGDYIALLDHDDELSVHALYMVAEEINTYPDAALIYSDEDKLTSYGLRFNPFFKSDWNPDLLLSQNCVCHLTVIRKDIVDEIHGFRPDCTGAQDWDLVLRASEQISEKQIRHIPHILYHWRVIESSTAQSTSAKPYVLSAQQKVVKEHLERCGTRADVEILENIAQLRVHFPLPKTKPLVSIIIPTRDQVHYLKRCISSITEESSYENFEIIIVDNNSEERQTLDYLSKFQSSPNIRVIQDDKPFNFSRINNESARQTKGEILAFLNNDLEVISKDWLEEMVSHAVRKEVGAVGARLLYPNNLLQHGGIILGIGGVAGHNHKGRRREDPGYFNRAILVQDLSAVTAACMLIRRSVFEEVNGFDEEELSVAFNDADLCLRIREKGYRVIYTPYAELYHHESISRGYENTPAKFARFEQEIENMKKRWKHVLQNDPYYNPNLTLLTEDFTFAFPPRVKKPWL